MKPHKNIKKMVGLTMMGLSLLSTNSLSHATGIIPKGVPYIKGKSYTRAQLLTKVKKYLKDKNYVITDHDYISYYVRIMGTDYNDTVQWAMNNRMSFQRYCDEYRKKLPETIVDLLVKDWDSGFDEEMMPSLVDKARNLLVTYR